MHGIPVTKFQTFREGEGSYRFLKYPLPKQQLQLLYPGRLMSNQWHYSGDNIPNEDPVGLAHTQSHMSALQRAAAIEEEALERHLGGRNKISRHPFVTPEASIEDPDLSLIDAKTFVDPNTEQVKSNLPSMRTILKSGEQASRRSEAESHRAGEVAKDVEMTGLSARNFREGFKYPSQGCNPGVRPFSPADPTHGAHPPDFVTPAHAPPFWRESFQHLSDEPDWKKDLEKVEKEIKDLENDLKKDHLVMWLAIGGGAILLFIIIAIIIYEIARHK